MAKKQAKTSLQPTAQPPAMDEADGVRVGEEPVPGMRLRCICRGHQGAIGRIAWSPCGRFIASPSEDETIRIWDGNTECVSLCCRSRSSDSFLLGQVDGKESVEKV